MKRLIVAADDFAQNDAVDAGIVALIEAGRISAASCLAASPRWRAAARRLDGPLRARADIGVHLDLTEFVRPAGGHAALIAACYGGTLGAQTLRQLVDEQLERYEDAVGAAPDYVDGHRHVHQLPRVRDALLDVLVRRYRAGRLPWVRVSRARGAGAGLKALCVSGLGGRALASLCGASGVECNQRLLGFYDFAPGVAAHRVRLRRWVTAAQDGDVLMCHPALLAEPGDPIGPGRASEFEALREDAWPALLAQAGITLSRGHLDRAGQHGK